MKLEQETRKKYEQEIREILTKVLNLFPDNEEVKKNVRMWRSILGKRCPDDILKEMHKKCVSSPYSSVVSAISHFEGPRRSGFDDRQVMKIIYNALSDWRSDYVEPTTKKTPGHYLPWYHKDKCDQYGLRYYPDPKNPDAPLSMTTGAKKSRRKLLRQETERGKTKTPPTKHPFYGKSGKEYWASVERRKKARRKQDAETAKLKEKHQKIYEKEQATIQATIEGVLVFPRSVSWRNSFRRDFFAPVVMDKGASGFLGS